MNARDEAEDVRLDWALGEKLGGEKPPDLAASIVARHRRGGAVGLPELPAAESTRGRWLAAALLLLGVGVVVAVGLRPDEPTEATPVMPAEPPAEIHDAKEAAALPATTRAVIAHDCGDDAMFALAHLRDLESLEVRVHDHEVFGLMLKSVPREPDVSITPLGLQAICNASKLRRLVLSGTWRVRAGEAGGPPERQRGREHRPQTSVDVNDEPGVELEQGVFAQLARLPLLSDLTLRFFDVRDDVPGGLDVLPKLPALRRLDLSFNHGFGERGIDAIVRCTQLEALSLRGCQQLQGAWLAKIGGLPELRELDVGAIDGINWRNVPVESKDAIIRATMDAARQLAKGPRTGVTDEALEGIARCRHLRRLDLSSGRFSLALPPPSLEGLLARGRPIQVPGTAVSLLSGLLELEDLDLSGSALGDALARDLPPNLTSLRVCSDKLTDAFCKELRQRQQRDGKNVKLQHLEVSACYGIHDDGIAELARIPTLRRLEMRQMYGLTAACIDHLLGAVGLQELDLRHCDFVTADHAAKLRAALPNLRELRTNEPR